MSGTAVYTLGTIGQGTWTTGDQVGPEEPLYTLQEKSRLGMSGSRYPDSCGGQSASELPEAGHVRKFLA